MIATLLAASLLLQIAAPDSSDGSARSALTFEVTAADGLISVQTEGRLFVVVSPREESEPRMTIGRTGLEQPPVFARDVTMVPGRPATIDQSAVSFPIASLAELAPGDYFVQAVFDINEDLRSVNAPGNLYSAVTKVRLDPADGGVVKLMLTEKVPPEELPADSESVRFVKIKSDLLSEFHGRPIYLRAGIILPPDHGRDPDQRYPLRVRIGGYGARYTRVSSMMSEKSEFRKAWASESAPRMIVLHLDGDGPLGDPYQVNSANHGPFGDAVVRELIPYVEKTYGAIGEPWARVVDGGSTGGWVSLALQIFYPDFFMGAWSYCPDSVDFRAFQLVNVYGDANAYVNARGFERPSARELTGDVRFTMRHELQMENLLGRGDSWTMSVRTVGSVERDLRCARGRRASGAALGPTDRRDRSICREALREVRSPDYPRTQLAHARPKARWEDKHLDG
jgi:hypothetical protein